MIACSHSNRSAGKALGLITLCASGSLWAASEPIGTLLSAEQICQALVGNVITDGAHWTYHLKRDGTIEAPDECWEVVREATALYLRLRGRYTYELTVTKPGRKTPPL